MAKGIWKRHEHQVSGKTLLGEARVFLRPSAAFFDGFLIFCRTLINIQTMLYILHYISVVVFNILFVSSSLVAYDESILLASF